MAALKRTVLLFGTLCTLITLCKTQCEIETGESVIIMDILESRGNQINQTTVPTELPIRGEESRIEMRIQTATEDYFALEGKRLRLKRPLDRDEEKLTLIRLQIFCRDLFTDIQRNIPVVIRVGDINDNPPLFKSDIYDTTVSELAPVGTTIFRDLSAMDKDSENNGLVEYSTTAGDATETDGYPFFAINLPYQGLVSVKRALDYERSRIYFLTIKATDKANNPSERLTSTTTLTIHVQDGDDLDPAFIYDSCTLVRNVCVNAEYNSDVISGTITGVLKIRPEPIVARDQDSLKSAVQFSFVNGTPSYYNEYFEIDAASGRVRQIKPVDRSQTKRFDIIVKAQEATDSQRYSTAKLTIDVQAVDNNAPVIIPSALEGYVKENSPIGTTVVTAKDGDEPLRVSITDVDIAADDPPVTYIFELTTNSFRVNGDGYLLVNEADLDRDPPNPSKYTFQVIARQTDSAPGKGASAPVAISVHLNDVNDNSPRLPTLTPVRIQAGEGVRSVTQIQARDNDVDDFAKVTYSIYHVSNNGQSKFRIDRQSGLVEVIDKVSAGEQYSITVQATDTGGRFTQSILDVIVVPGPNTGGPTFQRDRYDVQVSEGASINSTVMTITAEDPEKDEVRYSIMEGNINGDFNIDDKSGTISVNNRLDREEVSFYTLVIKAGDPNGLFTTTTVTITVTDINDQNPVFLQDEYNFKVDEGVVNAVVGRVQARDDDISINGDVSYSISGNSDFSIDSKTGEISTRRALDYEREQIHRLVVSARDQAPDARFATASVTVYINDIQDELPIFEKPFYDGVVPENAANFDILQVKATDPDSVKSITYMIRDGEPGLFAIDPTTGILRTLRGLDYERRSSYTLLIGTLENDTPDPRAFCTVVVSVKDRNDIPPVFTSVPLPIRLQDTVPLGTVVTTVVASDADGTPPGSRVQYEIGGREKAPNYFLIDSSSGIISVKDDLRKEPDSEYKIEVKARDLGDPPLSATATVTVYVEHIATVPPDSGLGFADSKYTVEVEENSLANTLVKSLPIINKPRGNFPIGCRIDAGNEQGLFYVTENNQRDCELRLQSQNLDYEKQSKYLLTVRLVTVGGLFGSSRLTTDVVVNVVDVNDNRPEFEFPPRYSHLVGQRYLSALPYDSSVGTSFLQVVARDRDSGSNSRLTYEIVPNSDPYQRFKIDPSTGFISNSKSLEDVSPEELPLHLKVITSDNPNLRSAALMQSTEVLVNVISNKNRMVMVVRDAFPERVLSMKEDILRLIQDRTGMIADLEKVVSLKMLRNNTIETDTSGSDLWFYTVDPGTLRILSTEDPKVKSSVLEKNTVAALLLEVSRTLGVQAEQIRPPLLIPVPSIINDGGNVVVKPSGTRPGLSDGDVSDLGAALIALASIIVVLSLVGIIYHCCMWSRYIAYRERLKRLYVAPRYEPVFVEPSLKEYETQVLQMSIPLDEEGNLQDPHLSLTLRGMEGVSYISKDRADGSASAYGGRNAKGEYSTESLDDSRSSLGRSTARAASSLSNSAADEQGMMAPARNPLFDDRGPDDDDDVDDLPVLKSTDDNVAFVETHQPREFSAENTTEL